MAYNKASSSGVPIVSKHAEKKRTFKIMRYRKNGSKNMSAFQFVAFLVSAQGNNVKTTWEIDGSLVAWKITDRMLKSILSSVHAPGIVEVQLVAVD